MSDLKTRVAEDLEQAVAQQRVPEMWMEQMTDGN
jgi:hypothetical protein